MQLNSWIQAHPLMYFFAPFLDLKGDTKENALDAFRDGENLNAQPFKREQFSFSKCPACLKH
jgi:hypothetical protein